MKHTTKLSIVIPAYNEEGNITTTVNGVRSVLVREQIPYEIVLVDDNSTDATGAAMESLAAPDPCIRIKRRKPPRGFGRAVRCGLESVTGDVVVICMADLSDDPEDIVKYYNKIEEGYDCVFGSRFIRGSRCVNYPRLKLFYNRIVNKVMQLLFWTRFNDLTNSFKSYRIHVIRDIMPSSSTKIRLLGTDSDVKWQLKKGEIVVTLPNLMTTPLRHQHAFVFRISNVAE